MKIDLQGSIAGVPTFLLRHALQTRAGRDWSGERLAAELASDDPVTLLTTLEREGWIERREGNDRWRSTVQGNALAQAKGRRVSRPTAQKHLDAFLLRVAALRDDPHHVWRVHRVAQFGSFNDPNAAEVGDVDLVVELATKEPNWERHLELEERYRNEEDERGRSFGMFIDRLMAPQVDALKFLKGRSSILSIHDAAEYRLIPMSAFTVIYDDPIDEPDRTHAAATH